MVAQDVECLIHVQVEAFASLPLACSMMTRLFSAVCSCSLRVSLRRSARSCSSLMVATPARAWPTRTPAGSKGPVPVRKRFVQQLHAAIGEQVQEVDDVEAGDHGVGQLDERSRQQLLVHPAHHLR
jgi:hypothetical protein